MTWVRILHDTFPYFVVPLGPASCLDICSIRLSGVTFDTAPPLFISFFFFFSLSGLHDTLSLSCIFFAPALKSVFASRSPGYFLSENGI